MQASLGDDLCHGTLLKDRSPAVGFTKLTALLRNVASGSSHQGSGARPGDQLGGGGMMRQRPQRHLRPGSPTAAKSEPRQKQTSRKISFRNESNLLV